MILYPFDPAYDVTIAAPGALAGATSVPVAPLDVAIASGTVLDFGGQKFARLSADAAADDVALAVDALVTALVAGDVAPVPGPTVHPLLSDTWATLAPEKQDAQHMLAELWLELDAPALVGDDAIALTNAIALQINLQLERGIAVDLIKTENQTTPGIATTYRDRWVHPGAAMIRDRVTGRRAVRFETMARGT